MDRVMSLVIRAECAPRAGRCDPASLAPAVRRAVWSVDRDQPIVRVATMDQLVAALAAERRFALLLFEAFGLAALAVRQGMGLAVLGAAVGLVGATRREPGDRGAALRRLAARPGHVPRRDRAARGSVGGRVRGARMAGRARGAVDGAQGGVVAAISLRTNGRR